MISIGYSSHKQEVASSLFSKADSLLCDNISQATLYSGSAAALASKQISKEKLNEIGIIFLKNGPLKPGKIFTDLTSIAS